MRRACGMRDIDGGQQELISTLTKRECMQNAPSCAAYERWRGQRARGQLNTKIDHGAPSMWKLSIVTVLTGLGMEADSAR